MIATSAYYPKYPLNQFIDAIWVGKGHNLDLESSHHAALFTELIFNYGDQFLVKGQNIENLTSQSHHQIISGLKTEPFHTKVSGKYTSVGFILKPFCYGTLLHKFDSKTIEQTSEILYNDVLSSEKPKFITIENHLLQLFKATEIDANLIKFERYINTELAKKTSLMKFNSSISISQKSFIHKFKKHYLLTPNQYIKLRKVNSAIDLINHQTISKLTNIGLDSGFYDQSHFIRIFKQHCGSTPKEFQKKYKR